MACNMHDKKNPLTTKSNHKKKCFAFTTILLNQKKNPKREMYSKKMNDYVRY